MRKLSDVFMENLRYGFLKELTDTVRADKDLDLHIRNNYINIYYKGNSLLNLSERRNKTYKVVINSKFRSGLDIPPLKTDADTAKFIEIIPKLKQNIIKIPTSLEIEYEQLIIRANNLEQNNNSDYYFVDRQYSTKKLKFDLLGFSQGRSKSGEKVLKPCLVEIKFALNPEIRSLPDQISRYYNALREEILYKDKMMPRAASVSDELQTMFCQKLELNLYNQPTGRLNALKKLKFTRFLEDFQFIIFLIDYNPKSKLFNSEVIQSLNKLDFASQIKIFSTGFGLWQANLKDLGYYKT